MMHEHRRSVRFDLVEVAAVGLLVIVAILTVAHQVVAVRIRPLQWWAADGSKELAPIAQRYGPRRFSRNMEEWLIRDFFQDRRGGVFVDVGANHYRDENNTYFLETTLGWSGIAIDAQPEFAEGYRQNRPRTRFFSFFIADESGTTEELYVPPDNSLVASSSRAFTEEEGFPGTARKVQTITLTDLLKREGVNRIDLLSMDIELAEPRALKGFDIDLFKPALVCIESHDEVRQAILDYFARHGYIVVGKYLRADPKNLYFMPVGALRATEPLAE